MLLVLLVLILLVVLLVLLVLVLLLLFRLCSKVSGSLVVETLLLLIAPLVLVKTSLQMAVKCHVHPVCRRRAIIFGDRSEGRSVVGVSSRIGVC